MWADGSWAVVLLGISVVGGVAGGYGSPAVAVPLTLLLCLVVALRRRLPEKMLLLAAAVGVAQLITDVERGPADFALLVIVYTVAAEGARWASRFALGAGLCAAPVSQLRWPSDQTNVAGNIALTVFMAVPFALAWVLGDSIRTRRAYFAQLEERAARLEREREAQSKVAVAAERARIARELHDVVAHNVSVMVVQADGAAYVLDAAPDQAKKALETISSTGRQALAEMRRLLGVLRTGEHEEAGEYVPQPDVQQIEDLVEQCRTSGLPVDFKVEGTPGRCPAASSSRRTASCRRRSPTPASTAGPTWARACAWCTSTTASACSSRTTARAPRTSCTRRAVSTAGATASSACASGSAWSAAPWTPDRARAEDSASVPCCRSNPPTDAGTRPSLTPVTLPPVTLPP